MSLALRTKRIDSLFSRLPHSPERLDPLIFSAAIPEPLFKAVQGAAKVFISKCLGEDRILQNENEIMEALERNYTKVLNLTPNGKLMPKPWLNWEYNFFVRELAKAIESMGINPLIEEFRMPTLRYKPAQEIRKVENLNRPYATEKMHNEMWISNKNADAVVIHLLIFGDSDNNHVQFFKTPDTYQESWMKPVVDFNEVADILKSYKPIEKTPVKGRFYVFEGSAVHATRINPDAKGRVSMELFGVLKEKMSEWSGVKPDDRVMDFPLAPDRFNQVGNSLFLSVKDTFSGVVEKQNLVAV